MLVLKRKPNQFVEVIDREGRTCRVGVAFDGQGRINLLCDDPARDFRFVREELTQRPRDAADRPG